MKTKPLPSRCSTTAGTSSRLQREDGANMFRNDVAIGKALASVGMGAASRMPAAARQGQSAVLRGATVDRQGKFMPQTGAVLIKDKDGNVLGAAGASGGTGDEDEAVCMAGITAAGLAFG